MSDLYVKQWMRREGGREGSRKGGIENLQAIIHPSMSPISLKKISISRIVLAGMEFRKGKSNEDAGSAA